MLIIRIWSEEKGVSGRLRRGMGRIRLTERAFRSGVVTEATVFCRKDRIKWKKIRKLRKNPTCAVISRGIQPPAGCGISRQECRAFREGLLLRTFAHAVRMGNVRTAGFFDPHGAWVDMAEALLPAVGQLRICTPDPDAYEAFARRSVAEYGTAPLISKDLAVLQNTAVLFLPEGVSPPTGCGLLFSQSHGYGVADAGLTLPADVQDLLTDDLSPLELSVAMVAAGLIGEGEVTCHALMKNGGMNTLRGICRLMWSE